MNNHPFFNSSVSIDFGELAFTLKIVQYWEKQIL